MTKTDICNLALGKLGDKTITNIEDPNDHKARTAKLHYGPSRDELLRGFFWSFALQPVKLTAEAGDLEDELDGWGYAFALPADFLKLEKITAEGGKVDAFRMQRANNKRCVLANVEEITLHYVKRIDDPDEYDSLFVAAFVLLLASRMARAITGSDELEARLYQAYLGADLPAARTADGQDSQSNENHPLAEIIAGSLTGSRGGMYSPVLVPLPEDA